MKTTSVTITKHTRVHDTVKCSTRHLHYHRKTNTPITNKVARSARKMKNVNATHKVEVVK